MATIERFEDLEIWKKAREFCRLIYAYTQKELFSKDFKLVAQIRSSSGSIMDNIAEGFERGEIESSRNSSGYPKDRRAK